MGHVYQVSLQVGGAIIKTSQCFGCESMALQPMGQTTKAKDGVNLKFSLPRGPPVDARCAHCGHGHHIGGPVWIAPIHDQAFVAAVLASLPGHLGTLARLVGMLTMAVEELQDVPLYYELTRVCSITKQSCGKLVLFLSAILNSGYRVSLTHANKNGIKTDAPPAFLWRMMRAWAAREGSTAWQRNLAEGTAGRWAGHPSSSPSSSRSSSSSSSQSSRSSTSPSSCTQHCTGRS